MNRKVIVWMIMSLCISVVLLVLEDRMLIKSEKEYTVVSNKYNEKAEYFKQISNNLKEALEVNINTYEDFEEVSSQYVIKLEMLQEEFSKNNQKKEALLEQRNNLMNQYNELLEKARRERNYIIENIETLNQYDLGFPNGCESVALTILLHKYNVNVSAKEVVDKLKKGDLPHYEGVIRYGGNPYLEFIGNPTNSNSYGVYDDPIIDVANYYKEGIVKAQGISLDEVLKLVKEGIPVVVWTSNNMAIPYINQSWIYKPTGETIYWMKNLHAVVVIGRADNEIIISDPINGKIRYFDKDVFESRYDAFGKRALYYYY